MTDLKVKKYITGYITTVCLLNFLVVFFWRITSNIFYLNCHTALSASWNNAYFSFLLFKDMNVNELTVLFSVMFIRNPVIIVLPIYTQFPASLFSDNKNVPDSQIENNSQMRSLNKW